MRKALKIDYLSRTPWEIQAIFQLFLLMRRKARTFLKFQPSDSLTDTLKRTIFTPPRAGGGACPPGPPPTGRPWRPLPHLQELLFLSLLNVTLY